MNFSLAVAVGIENRVRRSLGHGETNRVKLLPLDTCAGGEVGDRVPDQTDRLWHSRQ